MDDDEDLSSLLADARRPTALTRSAGAEQNSSRSTPPLNTVTFVDPLASGRLGVEA